jgi:uncharacterized protein YycO
MPENNGIKISKQDIRFFVWIGGLLVAAGIAYATMNGMVDQTRKDLDAHLVKAAGYEAKQQEQAEQITKVLTNQNWMMKAQKRFEDEQKTIIEILTNEGRCPSE